MLFRSNEQLNILKTFAATLGTTWPYSTAFPEEQHSAELRDAYLQALMGMKDLVANYIETKVDGLAKTYTKHLKNIVEPVRVFLSTADAWAKVAARHMRVHGTCAWMYTCISIYSWRHPRQTWQVGRGGCLVQGGAGPCTISRQVKRKELRA